MTLRNVAQSDEKHATAMLAMLEPDGSSDINLLKPVIFR